MRKIVLVGVFLLLACNAGDDRDSSTGSDTGSGGGGPVASMGSDDDAGATGSGDGNDVPLEACVAACKEHAGAIFSRCLIDGDQALCQANYNTALVQCEAIEAEDCDEDLIEMYEDEDELDGGESGESGETTGGGDTEGWQDEDEDEGEEEPDECLDGESMCLDAWSGVDCIDGQWSDTISCDSVCQDLGYDLSVDCNQVGLEGVCDCRYACNPATDTTTCSTSGDAMYWCWDGGWWEAEDCQARCEEYGYDYTTGCGWHPSYGVYDCYCY